MLSSASAHSAPGAAVHSSHRCCASRACAAQVLFVGDMVAEGEEEDDAPEAAGAVEAAAAPAAGGAAGAPATEQVAATPVAVMAAPARPASPQGPAVNLWRRTHLKFKAVQSPAPAPATPPNTI